MTRVFKNLAALFRGPASRGHLRKARSRPGTRVLGGIALIAGLGCEAPAFAGDEAADGIPSPSIATSLPANGDPYGVRKRLSEQGISYGLIYTGEALRNTSGGIRQGGIYEGKLEGDWNR